MSTNFGKHAKNPSELKVHLLGVRIALSTANPLCHEHFMINAVDPNSQNTQSYNKPGKLQKSVGTINLPGFLNYHPFALP